MTRRISGRLREEAAVACACMATLRSDLDGIGEWFTVFELEPPRIASLAYSAYKVADDKLPFGTRSARWAEAEALLRTGWTP